MSDWRALSLKGPGSLSTSRIAPQRSRQTGTDVSMATIGGAAAGALVGRLDLFEFVASLAWLLARIMFLIGFRNRSLVLFQ